MLSNRKLGFGLLVAAGCFLWNPVLGVMDILPDAIGYLLLLLGLSRLADLDRSEQLLDSQKAFRAMLWVGLGQILAELLVDVVLRKSSESLNQYEQPMWVLLFSFVLLVFQWYYLLPAWRRFFSGLSALAQFHGGTVLLREKRGRTWCERMAKASGRFVVLHSLLTLLPELTVLTSFEYDDGNPFFSFDWFSYANPLRTGAAVISGVIGVIWLVRYLRFMRLAASDTPWREQLCREYEEEVLSNSGLLLHRRMNAALTFFRVGSVFFINLSLMYYSVLPDWFCALLFFCGLLMLGGLVEKRLPCVAAGLLLIGVGTARSALNMRYLKEFVPRDALYLPNAYQQYLMVQILSVLEAILLVVFVLLVVRALAAMAGRYALAYAAQRPAGSEWSAELSALRLHKRTIPVWVFLALSLAAKICEIFLQQTYGWMWMVQFVHSFIASLCFAGFLTQLSEEMTTCCPVKPHV